MKARVDIDAGVCGFRTTVKASSDDCQHVRIEIGTDCEKIGDLSRRLSECVICAQMINRRIRRSAPRREWMP